VNFAGTRSFSSGRPAAGRRRAAREEETVPTIQLQRKLHVPADLAAGVLGDILQAIAKRQGPWRGFALHVGLGDLRLPDVGYVAIPIDLTAKNAQEKDAFEIQFSAEQRPSAFPKFTGKLLLEPGTLGESSLHLHGSYDLPMQVFGLLIDKALMPHVATKSLENFIDEMATACQARVDQREADYAQYHYYTNLHQ